MAKLNWQISRSGYGPQCEVVANTRDQAIGCAEAGWLRDHAWQDELAGTADEQGVVFVRASVPTFTAAKLGRAT